MKDATLRSIDRAALAIISIVLILSGIYLAGPWYVPVIAGSEQPIARLFSSPTTTICFGIVETVVGLGLLGSALIKTLRRGVISTTIFISFAVRLFSTIGVFIALNGRYLPPSYLSQIAVVLLLGSYWLYVKKRAFK